MKDKSKCRILFVDDNPVRMKIFRFVSNRDWTDIEVDIADNGQTAFNKLQKSHYDLLITDDVMPIMTGKALVRAIAKSGLDISIVLTSNAFFLKGEITRVMNSFNLSEKALIFKILDTPNFRELRKIIDEYLSTHKSQKV